MFSKKDLAQLSAKGISAQVAERQLEGFRNGFPFLKIEKAAEVGSGITRFSYEEKERNIAVWEEYLTKNKGKILKFVPASGAASRMFKDLFEFLNNNSQTPDNEFITKFFTEKEKFAFYEKWDWECLEKAGCALDQLLEFGEYRRVLKILLENGLNYGNLPKGLLLFHSYQDEKRTSFLEHLVEGVLYAKGGQNVVCLHFTVSPEHKNLFEKHFFENIKKYEKKFGVRFEISFSEQKKSTDTIAVTTDNEPFREEDGSIVFRPGGHGALIENLNDLDADIVFVKNIDNVVPDRLKEPTVEYKKLIAGVLVALQQQAFGYLQELENEKISDAKLQIITKFCESRLNNFNPHISGLNRCELIVYLQKKLNRPIRVCGMVKNEGEPGGGPYLVFNADGTISPQILESSQINIAEKSQCDLMEKATHFNPVDLVCGLKNYKGEKFQLLDYVDNNACFISSKSKNGKELKALELPGLWNGAMSDWNTVFVEVPIATFNPVKTVNDLLREQHQ
ncbi:MAG: DUF4301 family protein [Prevotellaceae bacterium]|jgi:hypothetical protein|nr:DUF4301 family protein [Prevotellaceae bacterium]